jgi:4-aminobutyrate--pyruvate transaminase
MIDLAEMLIERAPVPMSKVFFGNSGSEANDSAIKMIWYMNNALGRPKKKKLFSRLKGYHGITLAAASLTGLPANHKLFDAPIAGGRFCHVGTPHHYHNAKPGESEEDFATRLAEELEARIIEEGGAEECAAFWASIRPRRTSSSTRSPTPASCSPARACPNPVPPPPGWTICHWGRRGRWRRPG